MKVLFLNSFALFLLPLINSPTSAQGIFLPAIGIYGKVFISRLKALGYLFVNCYMLSAHGLISVLVQPEHIKNIKEGKFTSAAVAKEYDYVMRSNTNCK